MKHSFEKSGDRWVAKDRTGPSEPQAARSGHSARRGGRTHGGVDVFDNTKADLYQRAKRLRIPGRSKMNKRQLAEAIALRQG